MNTLTLLQVGETTWRMLRRMGAASATWSGYVISISPGHPPHPQDQQSLQYLNRSRVRTFLGDPSKSPIGDFRRPYFEKKETKRRLSGHKKETFMHLRSVTMIVTMRVAVHSMFSLNNEMD